MVAQEACTAAVRTDHFGKVFIAIQGMRNCLVCDQVFTRLEPAEHATVDRGVVAGGCQTIVFTVNRSRNSLRNKARVLVALRITSICVMYYARLSCFPRKT